MTIRFKLIIGFLILILIFIVDFFINQRLSREVIRNTVYINNSEAIIRNSNVLQRHMIDMQSGFRGYLLTGQESFLTPYDEGLKSIGPLVKEQRVLLNSERQLHRLDTIVMLHQRWIDYADPLIATKRDTLPEANRRYAELFDKKLRNEVGKNSTTPSANSSWLSTARSTACARYDVKTSRSLSAARGDFHCCLRSFLLRWSSCRACILLT